MGLSQGKSPLSGPTYASDTSEEGFNQAIEQVRETFSSENRQISPIAGRQHQTYGPFSSPCVSATAWRFNALSRLCDSSTAALVC